MTPASNPYAGLIERVDKRVLEHRAHIADLQKQYGPGTPPGERHCGIVLNFGDVLDLLAALSRLTRDVEELAKHLDASLDLIDGLYRAHDIELDAEEIAVAQSARATLTRLSRPIELGADPAFVASQSSPSVSTKGFNRDERKEAE